MIDLEVPPEFVSTVERSTDEDLGALREDVLALIERGEEDAVIVAKMVEVAWPEGFAWWYVHCARKYVPNKIVLVLPPEVPKLDILGNRILTAEERTRKEHLEREEMIGIGWIVGGLAASLLALALARETGAAHFLVFWGAPIYGFHRWTRAHVEKGR